MAKPLPHEVPVSPDALDALTNLKIAFRSNRGHKYLPHEIPREVARYDRACTCPACGKKAAVEECSVWRPDFRGVATFIRCTGGCPVVREERASA